MKIKNLNGSFKKLRNRVLDSSRARLLKAYLNSKNRPNVVFIWLPKTAGTSLHSLIDAPMILNLHDLKYRFPNRGTVTFGHMDYAQLVADRYVSSSFNESSYKFAITRNPYARAVSLYFYLNVREGQKTPSFREFCVRLMTEGVSPIGLYNVQGLSQCNPQVRWIERVNLDYLGRVETLNEDVNHILERIRLPISGVPKKNTTKHKDYREYYCDESKRIVEEFYREDFEALDYSYENWTT